MRQAAPAAAAPRRGERRIIERPRLIKLLDDSAARTMLLIAPAGYGKTTLARQWAAKHEEVLWYSARSGSADVAQLAVELADRLEHLAPGLSSYVSQFVRARPTPAQQVVQIVDGFAGAIGEIEPVTIAIDDYHLIAADEAAEQFVSELQQKVGLRLLIASRVRPQWATARLEMYGDLLEIDTDELALTDDEASVVLGDDRKGSAGLLHHARGWPAVVGLAAQAGSDTASPPDGAGSTLFRFFAEELFRAMPAHLQEQLITLALLPSLSSSLVDSTLGEGSQQVIAAAIDSGLATKGPDAVELHPLVREYLLSKLQGREDAPARVHSAFGTSLDGEFWDHAFELVERFDARDLLDPLIERSFKALLSSGRIATLERIAQFGHGAPPDTSPLIDLVDAELAFRSGLFGRCQTTAAQAALRLGHSHPLASHSWWVAGQAQQLSFDDRKAAAHFDRAAACARSDEDERNALWGLAMTLEQAETLQGSDVARRLVERRQRSPIDLVHAMQIDLLVRRATTLAERIDAEATLHALDRISDPRVKASFLNTCAYELVLSARYDDAHDVASRMRELAGDYQLTWAEPHAHWTLAAASLGRRDFREADMWLRRVEVAAHARRYGQLVLNASCLRARLLLALQRPLEAGSALEVDESQPASRAMKGEFLAMKALLSGIAGSSYEDCLAFARSACDTSTYVEPRAYAACALAVSAHRNGRPQEEVFGHLEVVGELHVWDAFITAARAYPPLLKLALEGAGFKSKVRTLVRESRDFDLAKSAKLDIGRRATSSRTALTRREREVLDLVRQGLTNGEIARTLWIAEATVKVHVRHILEKTGSRSRAEAVASDPDVPS
ncbi:MAG TPA: LuxR C-terminal-related transcriptional regulator [Gaiellaceae bacterium]|jgi:LuxR family maltose regulon positive regulatory protein